MKKTFRFFAVALVSFGMVMAVSCKPGTDDPDNPGGVDPTETGDPVLLDENFNAGLPSGWTTTDEDGDGYTWVLGSQTGGVYLVDDASLADANGGDMMCSGSYSNATGMALTPDNKLKTAQIHIPGAGGYKLTWKVQAQDATYAAEHYGVEVNGTEVFAETLTAKKAPGSWYTRTVSLDDFKGQDVTITFRHYNCSDMFILNLDDVKVANNI